MTYVPTSLHDKPPDSESAAEQPVGSGYAGEQSDTDHPRLIEEHHVVGPHGEDELEATDERGRRWYHLRPDPRRRAGFIGFNYTWWLIWLAFIIIVFLPWGRGWGY